MRTTPARCRHQPWLAETSLGSPLLFVLSADLIGYERPGQQWTQLGRGISSVNGANGINASGQITDGMSDFAFFYNSGSFSFFGAI